MVKRPPLKTPMIILFLPKGRNGATTRSILFDNQGGSKGAGLEGRWGKRKNGCANVGRILNFT